MPDHSPYVPHAFACNTACAEEIRNIWPYVDRHLRHLAHQFEILGLTCDRQSKLTPRGVTLFIALVGERGLLCMLETALTGVSQPSGERDVAVDVTLLDACGDVVTVCHQTTAEQLGVDADWANAMTSIYVMTIAQFDLIKVC